MGRSPCCAKEGLNRGAWTAVEDKILTDYIKTYGEGKWRHLPKRAGLKRCGKSCRLRWLNYLRPNIKRGNITREEEDLIIRLHNLLGNRWSLIAGRLPGRTDNEIKNYWNTNVGKKLQSRNKQQHGSSSNLAAQDSNPDPDPKPDPNSQPKAMSPGACLIRTKATRCTKVILSQELQPLTMAAHNNNHNVKMDASSDFVDSEEITNNNNILDFMVDNFEIDENVFKDLMNMELPFAADNNISSDDHQQVCYDNNNETFFDGDDDNVSDDLILHSSENFQSMSAFMENEFDWL